MLDELETAADVHEWACDSVLVPPGVLHALLVAARYGSAALNNANSIYSQGCDDGARLERERICSMARAHNYGPTLRTFIKWVSREKHYDEE
jgi:hypothetical protein